MMTQEQARRQWERLNRWRQRLVWQGFCRGGLLPWQRAQLRCYRDEMYRLDQITHPERYAALDAWEERVRKQAALAEAIEWALRLIKAEVES